MWVLIRSHHLFSLFLVLLCKKMEDSEIQKMVMTPPPTLPAVNLEAYLITLSDVRVREISS